MTVGAGPFLVTGATGNVGREVVRALAQRGEPVRLAVHREGSRADTGIPRVRLDFTDAKSFHPALEGCRGLFLMRPNPILSVKRTLNRLIDVATDVGVEHCVFLSVAGAADNAAIPHHGVEQHLMRSRLRWTFLRAGFFSQNLTGPYREDIREGRLVLPAGEGRVAYVDAYDLGDVAAAALCDPAQHSGQAYHLTGPDALTFSEVATLLSSELGRTIRYRAASIPGYWAHCWRRGLGIVPTLAYTVVHATLRGGSGASRSPTLSNLLGRPGRDVRQFIIAHRTAWA